MSQNIKDITDISLDVGRLPSMSVNTTKLTS